MYGDLLCGCSRCSNASSMTLHEIAEQVIFHGGYYFRRDLRISFLGWKEFACDSDLNGSRGFRWTRGLFRWRFCFTVCIDHASDYEYSSGDENDPTNPRAEKSYGDSKSQCDQAQSKR